MAIKTFRHKGIKKFFTSGSKSGIQPADAKRIGFVLDLLDAATEIGNMNFPGSDFHPN